MTSPFADAADVEHRTDRHGGVSSLIAVNGTVVAATHAGFLAAAAREVVATLGLREVP